MTALAATVRADRRPPSDERWTGRVESRRELRAVRRSGVPGGPPRSATACRPAASTARAAAICSIGTSFSLRYCSTRAVKFNRSGWARPRGDPLVKAGHPAFVDDVVRGDLHRLDCLPGGLFDATQQVSPARMEEEDRVAAAAGPSRPADPVNVAFAVGGKVVVDNMADPLHVQAAGGDVGGDDHVDLARSQVVDDPLALVLRDVAAQGGGTVPMAGEVFGERLGRALGIDEDQDAVDRFGFQDPGEHRLFLVRIDDHEALPDRVRGGGRCLIVISAGFLRCRWAIRRIESGMVAEKSAICRWAGAFVRIHSTSSAKPIRSISSASSRTSPRRPSSLSEPRSMWSMTRPGVPTTMWTPRSSCRNWT